MIRDGKYAGKSIAYCLASHDCGREILGRHRSLREKITQQGLNQLRASGGNAGTSPLFWLAKSEYGRSVLRADNDRLIGMINKDALNAIVESSEDAGQSALLLLASTEDGRSMLAANRDLCEKITLTGIKSVNSQADEIKSTLMYLLEDRQTRVIFAKLNS